MNWAEVMDDPQLQDLSYKIELNEWGNIVMSPASNKHGNVQATIIILLRERITGGRIICECSVDTRKGTKVADVAWLSDKFIEENGYHTPYQSCPELVVEIQSPSNSMKELGEKARLYFDAGAQELWICDDNGGMSFQGREGPLDHSRLVPDFPRQVNTDGC